MPSTFVCDRYEYPIEQLRKETLKSPLRVIIRGYAEIRAGRVQYFEKYNGLSKAINGGTSHAHKS